MIQYHNFSGTLMSILTTTIIYFTSAIFMGFTGLFYCQMQLYFDETSGVRWASGNVDDLHLMDSVQNATGVPWYLQTPPCAMNGTTCKYGMYHDEQVGAIRHLNTIIICSDNGAYISLESACFWWHICNFISNGTFLYWNCTENISSRLSRSHLSLYPHIWTRLWT